MVIRTRLVALAVACAGAGPACGGLIDSSGSDDDDGGDQGRDGDPGGPDGAVPDVPVWPNQDSAANSDPWLAEHHAEIGLLRPRILLLNFVNAKTNEQMVTEIDVLMNAFREGSRYHAYADPDARAMLEYQIAKAVDLRDASPPSDYPYRNSTLYPREDPQEGYWGFDYEQLWSPAFAERYGFRDPGDGHFMDLCELIEAGEVHEVWIYGDADVPDVSAAEILELKPAYDQARQRIAGAMNPCAGNGCFDAEDVDSLPSHCTRTIRIGWVNNTRGPGCYMESWGHGMESTGNGGLIPPFSERFREFGDFNLDTRFGTPFSSWYACSVADCLTFTGPTSLTYDTGPQSGSISDYVPACGNAHFAPNSRQHYDDQSPYTVTSTCEHFRMGDGPGGADATEPFSTDKFRPYDSIAGDCAGAWKVYWMQSMPGYESPALDPEGQPLLSFLPFVFY